MLEKLFISKVRLKMLRQYLYNPTDVYHVRGLVRILKEEINAVRRELRNLETAGLLTSEKRGNKLEYKLNPECIFLHELYALLRKDDPEMLELKRRLNSLNSVSTALVTEHFYSQKYPNDTDVDIYIFAETDAKSVNALIKDLEITLKRELRIAAFKTSEVPFHLKNRDPILLNALATDTINLIGSVSDLIQKKKKEQVTDEDKE
jgi:DNA-binding transcriptional ArsR family regulator